MLESVFVFVVHSRFTCYSAFRLRGILGKRFGLLFAKLDSFIHFKRFMDESQLLRRKGLFSGFSRLDADNHLLAEF